MHGCTVSLCRGWRGGGAWKGIAWKGRTGRRKLVYDSAALFMRSPPVPPPTPHQPEASSCLIKTAPSLPQIDSGNKKKTPAEYAGICLVTPSGTSFGSGRSWFHVPVPRAALKHSEISRARVTPFTVSSLGRWRLGCARQNWGDLKKSATKASRPPPPPPPGANWLRCVLRRSPALAPTGNIFYFIFFFPICCKIIHFYPDRGGGGS